MLYEQQTPEALQAIDAVRARYNGLNRSPFDEAECGHHYARALASWTAVLAFTGFHYSAVTATVTFNASTENSSWFWSNGSAWGTVDQAASNKEHSITLTVQHGEIFVKKITLRSGDEAYVHTLNEVRLLKAGDTFCFNMI
jgi:hypothetical protein